MPLVGATQLEPVNYLNQYLGGVEAARGMRVAQQQEQVNALQLQAAQQTQANNAMLQRAMAGGASDDDILRIPGGAQLLEQRYKAQRERTGAATADIERRMKAADFLAQSAGSWLRMPNLNKAQLAPWVAEMTQNGLISPEAAARFEQMPDDPAMLAQGLQMLQTAGLDTKSQLKRQFTNLDLGGTRRVISTPEFGGGPAEVVYEAPITSSPNAPRTNITNVLPGSDKFATELATGAAKSLDALRTGASSASRSIQTIERLRPLLDDPKFVSGTFANARLAVARALGQDVSATEAYFSGIAGEVAERIKSFGAGTGLSDKDREFAQAWAGGKPDLSAAGIKRILEINEESSRNVIGAYNAERTRLSQDVSPAVNQYYPEITAPSSRRAPAPGTVKNGYRFKGGDPANPASWEKVK